MLARLIVPAGKGGRPGARPHGSRRCVGRGRGRGSSTGVGPGEKGARILNGAGAGTAEGGALDEVTPRMMPARLGRATVALETRALSGLGHGLRSIQARPCSPVSPFDCPGQTLTSEPGKPSAGFAIAGHADGGVGWIV